MVSEVKDIQYIIDSIEPSDLADRLDIDVDDLIERLDLDIVKLCDLYGEEIEEKISLFHDVYMESAYE